MNPPGSDLFSAAIDADYVSRLRNAFWMAKLDGMLAGFTEASAIITPITGATDIDREEIMLVIFYAGINIVENMLRDVKTRFKAVAGPVSYETEQSANVLRDLLAYLLKRRDLVLARLSDALTADTEYFDMTQERTYWTSVGSVYWTR